MCSWMNEISQNTLDQFSLDVFPDATFSHPPAPLQQQPRSQGHIGVVVEDQKAGRHGAGP
jgi:hypothetical protein